MTELQKLKEELVSLDDKSLKVRLEKACDKVNEIIFTDDRIKVYVKIASLTIDLPYTVTYECGGISVIKQEDLDNKLDIKF